jgi:hypothetical protein
MRSGRRPPIEELRQAIDCLPLATRVAMLDGVRANRIIVGAYADRRGGVCPMLAAHRCGGRTNFLVFAKAWDRFAGVRRRPRRATPRELRVLVSHLEASILASEETTAELARAIEEHRELVARRRRGGDPDRSGELKPDDSRAGLSGEAGCRAAGIRERHGWAWLRPFRRYDEYERALEAVRGEAERADRELELLSRS